MVTHPEDYIDSLAKAGAGMITLHPETLPAPWTRLSACRQTAVFVQVSRRPTVRLNTGFSTL